MERNLGEEVLVMEGTAKLPGEVNDAYETNQSEHKQHQSSKGRQSNFKGPQDTQGTRS